MALFAVLGRRGKKIRPRESYMHEVINEVYLKNIFTYENNFVR
jgi:hypothetical protein